MNPIQSENSDEADIANFFKDSGILDMPHYLIRLYQKADERKNIVPFE